MNRPAAVRRRKKLANVDEETAEFMVALEQGELPYGHLIVDAPLSSEEERDLGITSGVTFSDEELGDASPKQGPRTRSGTAA
jgi:hypothetical protein